MNSELDPEVIKLWYHYEEVAMHFNGLIMQFRIQVMAGLNEMEIYVHGLGK